MSLVFDVLSGEGIAPFVPDLARLRVGVFRDWPYLYEGSLDYERKYLAKYVRLARATVVLARDGDAVVGASTALPLVEAEAELRAPFLDAGLDPADVYYYG
ncbi:MAG: GNAT family N-acetyltransferase, partial [Tagaea sp.]